MSKQILTDAISAIDASSYSWGLYFFHIDRRSSNPFKVHKVRFKSNNYLTNYAKSAIDSILNWKVKQISDVQLYNGENTKVSCDKLTLENGLLDEQWRLLQESVVNASDKEIEDRIMGYILEGQSLDEEEVNRKTIMFLKVANPVIKIENKRSAVFKVTIDNELDLISDNMYRLFLTTDCVIWDKAMYTFNHSFEKVFNLEKTMKKAKSLAIEKIINVDCFVDVEGFKGFANSYKSARTFLTLNDDRLQKMSTDAGRQWLSGALNIELDENNKFVNVNEEKASAIIKYLCFKIFKDDESKDLLEVSNAVKFEG